MSDQEQDPLLRQAIEIVKDESPDDSVSTYVCEDLLQNGTIIQMEEPELTTIMNVCLHDSGVQQIVAKSILSLYIELYELRQRVKELEKCVKGEEASKS